MRVILVVLLVACGRESEPELVATRDALASWERGVDALERDDPAAAKAAFGEALTKRDDPLLRAWQAKALADAGEVEAAVALLERVLAEAPQLAEARYNRAAYLARLEAAPEVVAGELRRALRDGARPAREVLADPDFRAYLGDPAFAFLPSQTLTIAVEAPSTTVFLNSDFSVRFRIVGAGADPLAVTAESGEGPARLLTVADDAMPSTEGTFRDLSYTYRVLGAGGVRLGPFHAWAGDRRAAVEAVTIPTAAPADRAPVPAVELVDLRTPREVIGRAAAPSIRFVDGDLVVAHLPGDRVEVSPTPASPGVHYLQRERGKTLWEAWRYPNVAPGSVKVRILRGGALVLEQ